MDDDFCYMGSSFRGSLLQVVLPVFAIDQWLYPFPHPQGPLYTYKQSFSIRLISSNALLRISTRTSYHHEQGKVQEGQLLFHP